jgi:hypothetical protein
MAPCCVVSVASDVLTSTFNTYITETNAECRICSCVYLALVSTYYAHVSIGNLSFKMSTINHFSDFTH